MAPRLQLLFIWSINEVLTIILPSKVINPPSLMTSSFTLLIRQSLIILIFLHLIMGVYNHCMAYVVHANAGAKLSGDGLRSDF